MKVATVLGARPQFIKAATVSRRIRAYGAPLEEQIVHTGQHHDDDMSGVFFRDLGIPVPAHNLGVSGGSNSSQVGHIIEKLEPVLLAIQPDVVLVYGDTNSTLAAAIVAAQLGMRLAHVEAGLRSFRAEMAEEINRVVTDRVSQLLFTPTGAATRQLREEGSRGRIHQVGDVMYDSYLHHVAQVPATEILGQFALQANAYVYATVHRAETVDDAESLRRVLSGIARFGDLPVVLPLHPRTRKAIAAHSVALPRYWHVIDPVPYLWSLGLLASARAVVTDSGGVQKEAYFAGVPCVTVRNETEWGETLELGWNRLAGTGMEPIENALREAAEFDRGRPRPPIFGEGNAAAQIVEILLGTR